MLLSVAVSGDKLAQRVMYQDGAMPFPEDWYVGRHIGLQS